jgi:hypothetical protein
MRFRRILRAGLIGAVTSVVAALALPALSAGATVRPAASQHSGTYIVFLKSPSASISTSARRAAVLGSQSSVTRQLDGFGAHVLARTLVPDTLTVKLTGAQVARLRTNSEVAHILVNSIVPTPTVPASSVRYHSSTSTRRANDTHNGLCGTASNPQLNPEALSNINAEPAIQQGFDGAGISVAFIADGVDTTNPDFQRNAQFATPSSATGTPVITNYQDFSTDGTAAPTSGGEAFLDASSIVAQGNTVYDLSNFVNAAHPLPAGCDIKIQGDAPGVNLTALKVFSSEVGTTQSAFIEAINYAVASGVKVLNESFGSNPFPDSSLDATKLANDAAVAAGVTVVVSSGDGGISSTIGSPSDDPNVISVGASTTFRAYQQDTEGGINAPVGNGKVADNNISSLSSGGFAQDGKTVDLVAPGDLNWALCSTSATYVDCGGSTLELSGGTSESAPLTSGAAADVIQAYASTHHGADPTPALVKHILTSSADDVFAPGEQQGAGLLDVTSAVKLARSIPGTTERHANGGLLANTSQLDLSGNPHTTASGTVALTNTSSSAQFVFPYARQLVQRSQTTGSVTLDPSVTTTQPIFKIWSGVQEIYQTSTFKVPRGTDRLVLNAAYQYTGQGSLLHMALFNPDGIYEGYSLPQGLADYADVQVAAPEAGKWTAVFFTEWDGAAAGASGTSGLVPYTASFWQYRSVGDVDPGGLFIAPGDTRSVTVHLATGDNPGDQGASLVIGGGMTVPITLRTVVKVDGRNGGAFSGVLTGGNGRAGVPAVTNTYAFTVPAGRSDLDASIAMSANPAGDLLPGDQFIGMLVDPTGQVVAYDTNYTYNQSGPTVTPYIQLYKSQPVPGQWQFVVDWAQPEMGVATSVPFTGAVRFNLVSTSSALPDSASSTVSASSPGVYNVTVNNTGVAPMVLSTDARLPSSTTIGLSDFFGSPSTQSLPGANNTYYVPTETSSLSVSETASVPATFDMSTYPGDPDISPQTGGPGVTSTGPGLSSSITYAPSTGVGSGLWFDDDALLGPFSGPATHGTETTSVTVNTLAFDTTVSSPTGDAVQNFTTGAGGFSPEIVNPGNSAVIPITIAPSAASVGNVVSGTLFVNGFTLGSYFDAGGTLVFTTMFTSEIAAIAYEYTVTS